MASPTGSVFHVSFYTPQGKLYDGPAGLLIIPGHDGQWGLLRNHCPMMCVLGYGLVRIEQIPDHPNAYFLINGGFARFNENTATILAYDVTTFEGMDPQKAKDLVAHAHCVVDGTEPAEPQEGLTLLNPRKAAMIVRMSQYARIES
jgi:F-type H+-transporting ATPase subunit epsilon